MMMFRDPGLILEREEDKALGRTGALPGNHHSRDAHTPAIARARQIGGAQHAAQRQLAASERHRVRADRQAHAGVICL
jgi:hypothetical protein